MQQTLSSSARACLRIYPCSKMQERILQSFLGWMIYPVHRNACCSSSWHRCCHFQRHLPAAAVPQPAPRRAAAAAGVAVAAVQQRIGELGKANEAAQGQIAPLQERVETQNRQLDEYRAAREIKNAMLASIETDHPNALRSRAVHRLHPGPLRCEHDP